MESRISVRISVPVETPPEVFIVASGFCVGKSLFASWDFANPSRLAAASASDTETEYVG